MSQIFMTKVVAILSSPENDGNAEYIVNAIVNGAVGMSTCQVYLHQLCELKYTHGCRACMRCKKDGTCAQDDDLIPVLNDIRDCDFFILSTPVFFNGPTAQCKELIDRMFSFLDSDMKSVLSGKKAIVVVSGGSKESADKVADDLEGVCEMLGMKVID